MTGPFGRINLALLYSPFAARLAIALANAAQAGHRYIVTCGWRSMQEQGRLYFQGRTTVGPIVTNARPGESAHNFGLAADMAPVRPDGTVAPPPSWRRTDFDALVREAERQGLDCGADWCHPDTPHVGWPGYVTAAQLSPLKALYRPDALGTPASLEAAWASIPSLTPEPTT